MGATFAANKLGDIGSDSMGKISNGITDCVLISPALVRLEFIQLYGIPKLDGLNTLACG
jgi:hypothetical protein|tara:strand:+ start:337 stop:513 length:177 start_codon:yes stop_codon:yes gene_type:complete